jgi:gluconolactonase
MGEMLRDFEIIDETFRQLVLPNCDLEQLADGMKWVEGPAYFPAGDYFLWSDIPNDRMLQWIDGVGVRVFRHPSNNSNGNTVDREGRLVTCEHGARRVTRTEHDGSITVIADAYQGKRLNSPNDVVVKKSDGSIWFTDPPYGILSDYEGHRTESEIGANYVYRYDVESGELTVVADDFDKPNGLAFSVDESLLYISDTGASHDKNGAHHIRVFEVRNGKELHSGRVFKEVSPGVSDGFRIDTEDNVWTSAGDGVHCYTPDGVLLGKVRTPDVVSNVAFGGPDRNRLFITAKDAVYSVFVAATGTSLP